MKTEKTLWLLLSLFTATISSAFSVAGTWECKSETFPKGFGSTLKLVETQETNWPYKAYLTLHNSKGVTPTNGWYDGFSSSNEDRAPTIYLQWGSGSGINEELSLIPARIGIYNLPATLEYNRMYVGIFKYQDTAKVIEFHHYECQ